MLEKTTLIQLDDIFYCKIYLYRHWSLENKSWATLSFSETKNDAIGVTDFIHLI